MLRLILVLLLTLVAPLGAHAALDPGEGADIPGRRTVAAGVASDGSYQVAQAGVLKFLRNIPTPKVRPPKALPLPKLSAGLRMLSKIPAPSPASLAKLSTLKASVARLPQRLKKLPRPSFAKLVRKAPDIGDLPPPGPAAREIAEAVPDAVATAPKRWRLNPRQLAKDGAIFATLMAIGIAPGQIVNEIYPVEGAVPATRVDQP